MTVRGWLVVGLVLQGCFSLLASFEHWLSFAVMSGVNFDEWLWAGALSHPLLAMSLLVFRNDIAGWILGPDADKPAPLDSWDLVSVGAALLGTTVIVSGCQQLETSALWAAYGFRPLAEGGILGIWLREIWLTQFAGFLVVMGARNMPRMMRLPRDRAGSAPSDW